MARFPRSSGVLLHPTALPGPCGIGTLGAQARGFLDWLEESQQSYWQICPLVPTGYGDSPYQGFSAFAGNPNLIDTGELETLGLLDSEDQRVLEGLPDSHVDYGQLIPRKMTVLRTAWKNFHQGRGSVELRTAFDVFKKENSTWLDDFCLFMVLKDRHGGRSWDQWDRPFRFRVETAMNEVRRTSQREIECQAFLQFLFHLQWSALKADANRRGIGIIGDLPIFIAYDSSDCWARPELFQLDDERRPTSVAGVPPDYFSATGQLWGNPLYDWDRMSANDFTWWLSVLSEKLRQYDILRIDHFRGFSAYWSVPYGETTAVNGSWVPAPGHRLFSRVREVMGELPIIAEDLGVITDDVIALIQEFGFPGMKVLQFAFDSSEENDYLPHNYGKHCLVYTGTHDNDTAAGWFEAAPPADREFAAAYLGIPAGSSGARAAQAMLRTAMASVADVAVTPLQDVLGLGSEARFNRPGTLGGNWTWRAAPDAFNRSSAFHLAELTRLYGRARAITVRVQPAE